MLGAGRSSPLKISERLEKRASWIIPLLDEAVRSISFTTFICPNGLMGVGSSENEKLSASIGCRGGLHGAIPRKPCWLETDSVEHDEEESDESMMVTGLESSSDFSLSSFQSTVISGKSSAQSWASASSQREVSWKSRLMVLLLFVMDAATVSSMQQRDL